MCGIAGVFGINNFTKIKGSVVNGNQLYTPNQKTYLNNYFSTLLHISQLRGQDSSGLFLVDNKQQYSFLKDTCTSSTLISTNRYKSVLSSADWDVCIGHSRAATVGGMTYDAAHPHIYENVMLVHNGTVRNHAVKLKGCPVGVSDSSALAWKLNEFDVGDAHKLFASIQDFGAVIWYDFRDKSLNIAKDDSRPLFWTKPPRKFKGKFTCGYISSQAEALAFVINSDCPRIDKVPSFHHYKYQDGEMKLFTTWTEYKEPPQQNYYGTSHYSHYSSSRTRTGNTDEDYQRLVSQYVSDDNIGYDIELTDNITLENGSKIRVNTVLDLGVDRPLRATYLDPITDTTYAVFIDQPPLSMFEEYEALLEEGGVVEIKYVHSSNIFAKVCKQLKPNRGRLNAV